MKLTVPIVAALSALKKNLEDHKVELKEALDGWTAKVTRAMIDFRDAVDRKGVEASTDDLVKLLYAKPLDSRGRYSKFIGALELSKNSGNLTMEIDEDDYDRMFADNWDWRIQSRTTNASYR